MKLFLIRNLFSILSAQDIIKQNKIQNYIFVIPTNDNNYYLKLKKNISLDNTEVIQYTNIKYPKLKNFFLDKQIIEKNERDLEKLLEKFKVTEVFITNLNDFFERHLSYYASSRNITVNLFEEGTNIYFNNILNSKIKNFVYRICLILFCKKYEFYFQQEKFKVNLDNVFCYFPEAYKFKNFKKIIKIKNNFTRKKTEHIIENLLVTRPLSEDNLLEEKEEIKIILNYLKKSNIKKLHFKPHPREKKQKIQKLIENMEKMGIECVLLVEDIPVEKIFERYDIKKIIGYETGSLVYLSELVGVECHSLIKTVAEKTKLPYFENYYEFYKQNFKKINYV